MTHLKQQIMICALVEIRFPCEVAESFQRRVTNSVHSRLGIRFKLTDEVAQHCQMRQTPNATALDDLRPKTIPNLQELSYVPQKSVGVFIKTSHQFVTNLFPLTWFRSCDKAARVSW